MTNITLLCIIMFIINSIICTLTGDICGSRENLIISILFCILYELDNRKK